MKIMIEDLPLALTIERVKEAVAGDRDYQELVQAVKAGNKPGSAILQSYLRVWEELSVLDGMVMREDKIVIPQADLGK